MIATTDEPARSALAARAAAIRGAYDQLSAAYQAGKTGNDIPLN